MKETITVEGKTLEVYYRNLFDNPYVVYNNKIWRITSKEGAGLKHVIGLDRELHKEHVYVKGEDLKNIQYILTRTGYITV
jgi:hypothetical protein